MANSNTSLYRAEVKPGSYLTLQEIREGIWSYVKTVVGQEQVTFNDELFEFIYNGFKIFFKVNPLREEGTLILTFFPCGEDAPNWYKSKNIQAVQTVLDFCALLNNKIQLSINSEKFVFERMQLHDGSEINTSNWNVALSQRNPPARMTIEQLLKTPYNEIFRLLPTDNTFFPFTSDKASHKKFLDELSRQLGPFGKMEEIRELSSAREFGEKFSGFNDNIFVFIETKKLMDEWYSKHKIYFDSNKIPTQFVDLNTIFEKFAKYPGTKANFIIEMLTKMDKKPFTLRPPEDIIDSDGFLCLSDIDSSKTNLFGALFTYSAEGKEKDEEVQIYTDIGFEADSHQIKIDSESLPHLASKVYNMIGRRVKIDIILTKRWKKFQIKDLVKKLGDRGIGVNKVYFISSKTGRFVDESVINGLSKTINPYIFVTPKVAYLRTATDIRFYAHLSSIYIKQEWPEEMGLTNKDLGKILWLVKKRLYRLAEYSVLTIPEPIHVFRSLNSLHMEMAPGRLCVPLRLLI